MSRSLQHFFRPDHWAPYEPHLRKKILSVVLWSTIAVGVLTGLVNCTIAQWRPALVSFSMAVLSAIGLRLNHFGRYTPSSLLVSLVIIFVIDYNMLDGYGLQDPAVIAFPILVIFGSLLFGKRAAPIFALVGMLSVGGMAYLNARGGIASMAPYPVANAVSLSVLIASSAVLIWVIMDSLEINLARLRQSEADLRTTYDLTLEGWARALEYHDRGTEGHSRRVAVMCARLARELGLDERRIAHIYRGALLHDIGKMAIPDSILTKPGPLNEEEWELMKRHPIFALNMLEDIPYLEAAVEIPHCHHERWDGKGYPRALKGTEIPLAARLFSIVDQYDALGVDRPYRKAWTQERILAFIEENAGVRYDPDIVPVFMRLLREHGANAVNYRLPVFVQTRR